MVGAPLVTHHDMKRMTECRIVCLAKLDGQTDAVVALALMQLCMATDAEQVGLENYNRGGQG